MKKRNFLNSFEKKTLLNNLKELNVINMVLSIDDAGHVFYVFFFEVQEFIFTQRAQLSYQLNADEKIDIERYLKRVKKSISDKIDKVNGFLCENSDLKANEDFTLGHELFLLSYATFDDYCFSGIIKKQGITDVIDIFENSFRKKLRSMSNHEVISEFFDNYDMNRNLNFDMIASFKNPLEDAPF